MVLISRALSLPFLKELLQVSKEAISYLQLVKNIWVAAATVPLWTVFTEQQHEPSKHAHRLESCQAVLWVSRQI